MADRDQVMAALAQVAVPGGGDLVSRDLVRALIIDGEQVRFVIEVADAEAAGAMQPVEFEARRRVEALPGVVRASIVTTAPAAVRQAPRTPPPELKIGRHPTPQAGPEAVAGVDRVIVVGSGKGGVGKSTLTSNLAVALARQGRRVGLLDADIYGPSQPRMMGASGRPEAPDGKTMQPLVAHGVKLMSLGLMVKDGEAIVWRGPMLMGAMQQMLGQVAWGPLDVLLIDLPPGTGDVQLTLCQKTRLNGAIIVSTPQDVALIDARRAIDMFTRLNTPVLGLVENMASFVCPNCGHEAHPFGHGGVRDEARRLGVPFLGEIPLDLETRLAGDSGTPIAAGEGPAAAAYARMAKGLIEAGIA